MWWSISTERCEAEVVPSWHHSLPVFPPSPPPPLFLLCELRSVPSLTPASLSIPSMLAIAVETPHIRDHDAADAGTATLRAAGATISGHPSGLSACSAENLSSSLQADSTFTAGAPVPGKASVNAFAFFCLCWGQRRRMVEGVRLSEQTLALLLPAVVAVAAYNAPECGPEA